MSTIPRRGLCTCRSHLSARRMCRRPGRPAVQPRSAAPSKEQAAGAGGPGATVPLAEMTLSTTPAMPALIWYGPACTRSNLRVWEG